MYIVFLKVTGSLCIFSRKCLPHYHVWITSLSVNGSFEWKQFSMKKLASQLTTQSHKSCSDFCYIVEMFLLLSVSSHRILKRCIQEPRFNKINFYCFIKDILKWNWLFPHASFVVLKNVSITGTIKCHYLIFMIRCRHFIHCCFCSISANLNTGKRTNNILLRKYKFVNSKTGHTVLGFIIQIGI